MKTESLKQSTYVAPVAEVIFLRIEEAILTGSENVEDPDPSGGDSDY